ncbi:MAG TPA: carbohydrate ABC transporter permease [Geminicoccaceae bacterium]|nr:carbohydrate ABC transporter permease [Geminicoccus sp.]HMU50305.1 carbohydrate ABC transporter permease [Geminicoccaceae bacterium]
MSSTAFAPATVRSPRAPLLANPRALARQLLLYLGVSAVVGTVCFPLFWMVSGSFKPRAELYAYPPTFLPQTWTLENYQTLLGQTEFLTYFANSLIVAFGATGLALLFGTMGAYSLTRFRFAGLRLIAQSSLFCYMLPEALLVIPLYMFVVNVGLADTLYSLILSNTAFTLPLTLWFMRSYFAAIPPTLEESAMIDGCTRFQAFYRVTLPLALPGVVSVGVFGFNHAWNEFLFALVFTSSERNKVLPIGLATWIGQDSVFSWGMLLAAAVLITLPVVLFYLLVQRHLVSGLAAGGVKGE